MDTHHTQFKKVFNGLDVFSASEKIMFLEMKILVLSGHLLLCAGLSLSAQINGTGKGTNITAYQQNTRTINIADIKIKDTLDFNIKNLNRIPNETITNGDFAYSYNEQCFYIIKTLNENNMQYSIVKYGANNKEMLSVDISTWVQHLAQRVVDSGLCNRGIIAFNLTFGHIMDSLY